MFSRSFRRKIGSTFLTLAAPSSMISLCGSNKVCASKEFLNSKLFQAMLKVFENNDKDNENNNNIIRRLDCDSLWNNQSTKKGTNVETLSKKKLETLVALYYIANKYKNSEQKTHKANALLFDVETVLQGNMEEKIEEFFKSEFFKKYCKDLLTRCYIKLYESTPFPPSEEDLDRLDYYTPAYNASIEEAVSVLSSSDYKEALFNKKGEYDKKTFSRRFLILNGFYTFMLKDLSLLENFKFREIRSVGTAFILAEKVLEDKAANKLLEDKVAYSEYPQVNKDNFVFMIRYSKKLIEGKFLKLEQVLDVLEYLGSIGTNGGIEEILNMIKESKKSTYRADTAREIIYVMSKNYMVIDSLINPQENILPLLNIHGRDVIPYVIDEQTGESIDAYSAHDVLKHLTDPIFASSRNDF